MQLDAQSVGFGGGMTEAVVADGAQSEGQRVAQIVADEFSARQRLELRAVMVGAIFPAETDGVVGEGRHPRIIDGGTSDVGAEIFDGASAGAGGLDVHSPIFSPCLSGWLPTGAFPLSSVGRSSTVWEATG